MGSLIAALLGLNVSDDDQPVRLGDIEAHLRSISGGAQDALRSSKSNVVAAASLSIAAIVAGAYLQGRRRGRRRVSVLEIRKI